MILHHASDYE